MTTEIIKQEEKNLLKEGRKRKDNHMHTEFELIDNIMDVANVELLGFYIGLKSYINRKDNTKDNQITYSQSFLAEQMGNMTNYKYYKNLHTLFEIGLIDIEKEIVVSFFINYDIENIKNPLVEKKILYFSTLNNINYSLKNNIEKLIAINCPEIPLELINVVKVSYDNSMIIHDYPPYLENVKGNYYRYRNWKEEMNRFQNKVIYTYNPDNHPAKYKKNELSQIEGVSNNQNQGVSNNQNQGVSNNQNQGVSNNQNHNIINALDNNINTLLNSISDTIFLSPEGASENSFIEDNSKEERKKDSNTSPTNEFNNILNNCNYQSFEEKDTIFQALRILYYSNKPLEVSNMCIPPSQVRKDLEILNCDHISYALRDYIIQSTEQEIKHPAAYLSRCIYNSIFQGDFKRDSELRYAGLI